jgi:hypothetical protein
MVRNYAQTTIGEDKMKDIKESKSGVRGVIAILISTLGFALYPIFGKVVFAGAASL